MRHSVDPADASGASPRQDIAVLGMHRSGTSLTARLLGDLGWHLGRPDELLGPREDNPAGFFERADVQLFNERVLNQLEATWENPPGAEEVRALGEEGIDTELNSILMRLQTAAGAKPFAVKDPRLCVLWPLWERHLPPSASLVLIFRHPVEVAISLYQRDGMPLYHGIALWDEYVRRSLEAAGHRAAVVLRHGDLLADPEASVYQLAESLGRIVPAGWTTPVRSDLYRSRGGLHEPLLTSAQHELWSWIEALPASIDRILPSDVPPRDPDSFTDVLRQRRGNLRLRSDVEALRRSLVEARENLDARDASLAHLSSERDSLARSVQSLRQRSMEQSQRAEIVRRANLESEERLGRELATLGQRRDELLHALTEQKELVRVGRARERVLAFERHNLIRALTVVEAQRRAQETQAQRTRGSRARQWWRTLAAPVRRVSARRGGKR